MVDLKAVLEKHKKWLMDETDGERADLRNANLCGANLLGVNLCDANLRGANLCDANLRGADLRDANLCDADLRRADLRDANLRDADLRRADLRDANLCSANLCSADLRGANLLGANLCDAKNIDNALWSIYTTFYPLQCPESGSYIGYKKAHELIVELEITEDALRSSATSRKCRASKAKVLSITDAEQICRRWWSLRTRRTKSSRSGGGLR